MNNFLKICRWFLGEIIKDIFRISLATLVIFFTLETFEPGLVSNHLSLNFLLVFCLAFGIITAVWHRRDEQEQPVEKKGRGGAYFWGFIFGAIIILLVSWQVYSAGLFGYAVSLLAGLVVVLMFVLVRMED